MTPLPPFEAVLREHGPAVLRFCVARRGPHAGQDAFQEAMIAALRAYPELRDPGAVRGWLFSIAHRKTIDGARADQRQPRPAGSAEEVELAGPPASSRGVTTPFEDPIWGHVRSLPRKQREAVTLRFLADLTYAEIAQVMDTSEEAARRSAFEGVRRLRTTAVGASHDAGTGSVLRP